LDLDFMSESEEVVHGGEEPALAPAPTPRRAQPWRIPRPVKNLLEEVYDFERHPSSELRRRLAVDCGVTPRQIQLWFQNRRYREKGQKLAAQNGTTEDSPVERLAARAAATREAAEKARTEVAASGNIQDGSLPFTQPSMPMCCMPSSKPGQAGHAPMMTVGQQISSAGAGGFLPYYMQAAGWPHTTEQHLATLAAAQSVPLHASAMPSVARAVARPAGAGLLPPEQSQSLEGAFPTSRAPAVAALPHMGGLGLHKPWMPQVQPAQHLDMQHLPINPAQPVAAGLMPQMAMQSGQPQGLKQPMQPQMVPSATMGPGMVAPVAACASDGWPCQSSATSAPTKDLPLMPPNLSKLPPQLLSTQYLMQVYDDTARRRQLSRLAEKDRSSLLVSGGT